MFSLSSFCLYVTSQGAFITFNTIHHVPESEGVLWEVVDKTRGFQGRNFNPNQAEGGGGRGQRAYSKLK